MYVQWGSYEIKQKIENIFLLKLLKDKRLTTPIFTHFEIQASWSYFSVLSLTGVKRNDYILPEIMSRPSKVAFMSF